MHGQRIRTGIGRIMIPLGIMCATACGDHDPLDVHDPPDDLFSLTLTITSATCDARSRLILDVEVTSAGRVACETAWGGCAGAVLVGEGERSGQVVCDGAGADVGAALVRCEDVVSGETVSVSPPSGDVSCP